MSWNFFGRDFYLKVDIILLEVSTKFTTNRARAERFFLESLRLAEYEVCHIEADNEEWPLIVKNAFQLWNERRWQATPSQFINIMWSFHENNPQCFDAAHLRANLTAAFPKAEYCLPRAEENGFYHNSQLRFFNKW